MQSFHDEMSKLSAPVILPKNLSSILGSAGSLGGIGAAVGGVGNTLIEARKQYKELKEQGVSTPRALAMSGVGGAVAGLPKGVLYGGLAGAAGGAGAAAASKGLGKKLIDLADTSAAARSGQRQMHTLSGYVPEGGLERIRAGTYGAQEGLDAAKRGLEAVRANPKSKAPIIDRILGRSAQEAAEKGLQRAQDKLDITKKTTDMGLTSVPGMVHSVRNHGVGGTIKALAQHQIKGESLPMQALQIGMPAVSLAGQIRRDPDSIDEQGHTKRQGIVREATNIGANLLTGPMTMTGQMLSGMGLQKLTGMPFKRHGQPARDEGSTPPLPSANNPTDSGSNASPERVVSDRAAGITPEGY
jgi:hypothetical protein